MIIIVVDEVTCFTVDVWISVLEELEGLGAVEVVELDVIDAIEVEEVEVGVVIVIVSLGILIEVELSCRTNIIRSISAYSVMKKLIHKGE